MCERHRQVWSDHDSTRRAIVAGHICLDIIPDVSTIEPSVFNAHFRPGHLFDDLIGTVFEGHHQPLRTWVLCLYFMWLNLSTQQIAAELDLHPNDAHDMTTHLREGIEVKKSPSS